MKYMFDSQNPLQQAATVAIAASAIGTQWQQGLLTGAAALAGGRCHTRHTFSIMMGAHGCFMSAL
jgi:hypothetical protein